MPSLLDECVVVADVNGHVCLFNVTSGHAILLSRAAERLIVPLLDRDISVCDLTSGPAVSGVIASLIDQGAVAHALATGFQASTDG